MNSGLPGQERTGELRKHVVDELPELLDGFYKTLMQSPASEMFAGGQDVAYLKKSQGEHWQSLFAEVVSEEALGKSQRIGEIHQRIGLPSAWYLAAYGWVMMKIIPLITRHYRFRRGEMDEVLCTLVNRLFTDMVTSVSAYERSSVDRAVQDIKDLNTENLAKIAESVSDVNNVILNLAFLQKNTKDVAGSSQTISSASTELVSSVEEIATNSENASGEADQANQSVSNGRAALDRMTRTISNISETVDQTSENVNNLAEASNQIGQILSVIEDIAEQTNLLALNATIEAARAGEAGKGFAVVASEVKSLANQTARATEDITKKITSLRDGMSGIQSTMQASMAAVDDGEEAIQQALEEMAQITDQVGGVSGRMMEISGILGQQQGASAEIAQSISGVAENASKSDELVRSISNIMHTNVKGYAESARNMFDEGSDVALCYMTKIDHVLFKQRVVDTCMGHDNWRPDEVPDHHGCRLGKWYDHIENEEIRSMGAYQNLVEPHKRVHQSAKDAISAFENGDMEGMLDGLHRLDAASVEVLKLLDELAQEISHRHAVDKSSKNAA